MLTASNQLDGAANTCQRVPGKGMCLDFFIMNCAIAGLGGDCRGFDRDATFGNSRVQMYLNPITKDYELKFSCTRIVLLNQPLATVCDSAAVFVPARDVVFTPDGGTAFFVSLQFANNACKYINEALCPSISAQLHFVQDAAAPAGWRVTWIRDGFPSMGVYSRNASDTGFDTVVEDPQKVFTGVQSIRALAGEIRSAGSNVPPPDNPNNCSVS